MKNHNISRRRFIGQSACAAVGSSTLFSSLLNMQAANAASISSVKDDDYKALVCILMAGGNDSFNMLVPTDPSEYGAYRTARSNLALDRDSLLDLNINNVPGRSFAIHPSMPEVQQLHNDGKLAFISNIGTLIEPVGNKQQVINKSIKLPLGLQSHSDQIMHWQTGFSDKRSSIGWGGKVADLINDMNDNQRISMNVSLAGSNVFQTGNNTVEYTLDPERGSIGIQGLDDEWTFNRLRTEAIESMVEQNYQDIFKKTYMRTVKDARNGHREFKAALDTIEPSSISYAEDPFEFGLSMQMIARTIAARQTLGMKRQTFFVLYGGWDHHDEVLNAQNAMLGFLSRGIGSFQKTLQELDIEDSVTTFTISDFARTLSSNGNGTDHGWGGNAMVFGGAVNGNKMYGEYPDLTPGSNLDIRRGILYPTTSADEYFAELSMWFGVAPTDLPLILPNIRNFYDLQSAQAPLGFLNLA